MDAANFKAFFDLPTHLFNVIGSDGTFKSTNIAQLHILGFHPEELIGKPVSDYVLPEDAERTFGEMGKLFQDPSFLITDFQNRCIHKEGGYRWISWSGRVVDGSIYCIGTDISERKKAEEIANESRNQLQAILQGVTSGVIAYDKSGNYLFANDTAARMSGYENAEEFIRAGRDANMKRFTMTDENGAPLKPENLPSRKILSGADETPEIVVRYHSPVSESFKWSLLKSRALRNAKGELTMVITIFTDFTERKTAELERERLLEEVSMERARFQAVLRQADVGLMVVEAKTFRPLFVNERVEEIWRKKVPRGGVERYEQFQGFKLDGTPVTADQWPSYRALAEGISIDAEEIEIIRGDGTRGYALFSADPLRDAKGEIVAAVSAIQDVTYLREREQASRFLDEASKILSSSLDYRQTLKTVADLAVPRLGDWCSISLLEKDGPTLVAVAHRDPAMIEVAEQFRAKYPPDWNADTGQARVLKTGKSELIAVIPDELLVQAAIDEEHLRMLRLLKVHSILNVPITSRDKTLGVLTLISSNPGRVYNESDLRVAEELGKRAGLGIENSQLFNRAQTAIRARDEFLSIASHELRTPITGMKLQAQIMKRSILRGDETVYAPARVQKLIEQTDDGLTRLTRLVEDMLDISRIQSGKLILKFEKVDLVKLMADTLERHSSQLQNAGMEVHFNPDGAVMAECDPNRLEQVLTNLLMNAIRYAPKAPIEVKVQAHQDFAEISVKDQGPGIRVEDHERIFGRFERLVSANEISGLGLGLSISRDIVQAHSGEIKIESTEGKGARFIVSIPLKGTKVST